MKQCLLVLLILICLTAPTYADCGVSVLGSSGLPIVGANVTIRDLGTNATVGTNVTDSTGSYIYIGDCSNLSLSAQTPSSNYAAVLSNGSISALVPMGGSVSARVQLKNTLGSYLEAQDCSVVSYKSGTSELVYDYLTQCGKGEPFIDSAGNWATVSNCPFTDSQGWYYFRGDVSEKQGYAFDENYDLVFTCNGKQQTLTFKTDLGSHADLDYYSALVVRQGGIIIVYALVGFVILIVVVIILALLRKKQSSHS